MVQSRPLKSVGEPARPRTGLAGPGGWTATAAVAALLLGAAPAGAEPGDARYPPSPTRVVAGETVYLPFTATALTQPWWVPVHYATPQGLAPGYLSGGPLHIHHEHYWQPMVNAAAVPSLNPVIVAAPPVAVTVHQPTLVPVATPIYAPVAIPVPAYLAAPGYGVVLPR